VFSFSVSDNKSNRAEFIRIPPDAPVMEVKELLNQQWCRGVKFFFFLKKFDSFIVHFII
jgi:hypothetical protein